jgi:Leucine-rich repeat (LRR) protein
VTRDTRIQDVLGVHKPGRTNLDVLTLYSYNSGSKYLPKRVGFMFPNLKTLLITKSNLRLIEFRDFKNMKKLQKLYLTENKIEKIPACVFKYAENLEIIDLSGNQIIELNEDTFINLSNLQQFLANDNAIKRLEQGLFRNNVNLRRIAMQQNQLSIIEVNFMKIKGIELVDLRHNLCINLTFGCCKGPAMRDFMNQTSGNCKGPEVC